jgi:hypothetical protein
MPCAASQRAQRSLERRVLEHAEVPVDRGDRRHLQRRPVLPERRQHRHIDRHAGMLHAGGGHHEPPAQQGAVDVELGQHHR